MSKKSFTNTTHIEGYLYSHDLSLKTVANKESKNFGTEFISGTIDVATNEALTNIVSVHYTFVTGTTSTGKANATYNVLKNIIDEKVKTVMGDGKENAAKVRVDSAIALNEFYTDRNGEEELVSAKRNEGGFIHLIDGFANDESKRATFRTDMIITNVTHIDADEERGTSERVNVKGYIFNFRKAILPVEFMIDSKDGMAYFEKQTYPIFVDLWGRQISEVIVRKITEQSAFGEDNVREVTSSRKSFAITGIRPDHYAWDDPDTITVVEIKEALAQRETDLAAMKRRNDEWRAQQNTPKTTTVNNGGFNF